MNNLGQAPTQQNPFAYLAAKYWWLTIPVFAIAAKRHFERQKKGKASAFDVFNDLGILSFPITGIVALYEFGEARQQRAQILTQLQAQALQQPL